MSNERTSDEAIPGPLASEKHDEMDLHGDFHNHGVDSVQEFIRSLMVSEPVPNVVIVDC
jgi:hypothetical protein